MPSTATRRDQTVVGRYHGVAEWRSVTPENFDALQMRLLGGRLFTPDDDENAAEVVLINREMLKRFWPEVDANPIGEFIIIGKGLSGGLEDRPRQIVGVVDDIRQPGLYKQPMMYVPSAQVTDAMNLRIGKAAPLTWVLRTKNDAVSKPAIEQELKEASSGVPVGAVRTMRQDSRRLCRAPRVLHAPSFRLQHCGSGARDHRPLLSHQLLRAAPET
jgi:hypothetical protein